MCDGWGGWVQWNRRLDDIWRGKPWDALDATLCDVRYRYPNMDIEPFKDMIQVSSTSQTPPPLLLPSRLFIRTGLLTPLGQHSGVDAELVGVMSIYLSGQGMVMDVPGIGQNRYQTFEELYLYCYRYRTTHLPLPHHASSVTGHTCPYHPFPS